MLKILAVDKASGTLNKVGGSMGGLGKKAGAMGAALGAALSVGAVTKFAGDSVKAFETTGKETLKLQRYMGGTAEEASRLGHAFTMSGIDSETSAKNIGILSKKLVANDKAVKGMGVAYRDANGKMKPMDKILPGIADKFAKMPNGPEKTALAMKLFGKGGAAMIPMLNKGSAGLKAMAAESDKLGTTLSGKDLEAVKQSTINKRKMSAAVKGLQIAIGKNLLPIIQKMVTWFTERIVPAIGRVIGLIEKNKDKLIPLGKAFEDLGKFIGDKVVPAVVTFGGWLVKYQGWLIPIAGGILAIVAALKIYAIYVRIVAAVTKAWAAVQAALNVVMTANPLGLIILAVIGLVAAFVIAYKRSETFRNVVDGAFRAIKNVVMSVVNFLKPFITTAFSVLKNVFTVYFNIYKTVFTVAFRVIKAVVVTAFNAIKATVMFVFNALKTVFTFYLGIYKAIIGGAISVIKTVWSAGFNFFKTKVVGTFNGIKTTISNALGTVWGFITDLKTKITGIGSNLWEGLKTGLTSVIGFLRNSLNGLIGLFNKPIEFFNNNNGPLPNIPLIPDIPALAKGGIVTRPTLALIGEAGPEAVVPLTGAGGRGFGGGTTIIVNTGQSVSSKDDIAREIRKIMREGAQRGAVPAAWNVA
jgi:phage-related minor tail protein